tara:strand:+ start:42 stop:593 length:552 start_codon:yes stop_codon:yes gene_type:complete
MSLTADISRTCKDSIGGIYTLYVFPYVKYSRTNIITEGQRLTSFPSTTLLRIDAINVSFNENSSFEGGSERWQQNFSFDVPKTKETRQLFQLLKQNYSLIYTDRLGNNRILGLYNGLESEITDESGQERTDFNGYRVTMDGLEDNQAYFIDDIEDAGFITGLNFIFENENNFIFEDNNNFITQ